MNDADVAVPRDGPSVLRSEGSRYPRVDPQGVTFLYQGAADSVGLRCWIHGLPASQPFDRIEGTDDWILRIDLPPNSRIEYKFEVVRDGQVEWITDPANPLHAADPFGANSVVQGYGYVRPDWTLPDSEARAGQIDELEVATALPDGTRRTRVYIPARFRRSRRYPLLVVHDGTDFLRYASLQVVLDNLIHRLEIPPLIVALTDSPERLIEYAGHEGHARFVAAELPAALGERFPLRDDAGARGLMGASFGAVAVAACRVASPGTVRPAAARIRLIRLLRHRPSSPLAGVRSGRALRKRVPVGSRATGGTDLRELRDLRIADLREPQPRAAADRARAQRPLRGSAGRAQLGELARPAPGSADLALSRPACGWSMSRLARTAASCETWAARTGGNPWPT